MRQFTMRNSFLAFMMLFFFTSGAWSAETYKFERMWPALQNPWYFEHISELQIDGNDNIYAASWFGHGVQKYTANGRFIGRIEMDGGGMGRLVSYPDKMVVSPAGNILLLASGFVTINGQDMSGYQKYGINGEYLGKWQPGEGWFGVHDGFVLAAMDDNWNIYAVGQMNGQNTLLKHTASGTVIALPLDPFMNGIVDVGVDVNGYVYIPVDGKIIVYDLDNGREVQQFLVDSVTVSSRISVRGEWIVVNTGTKLLKISTSGQVLLATDQQLVRRTGWPAGPVDPVIDSAGNLYYIGEGDLGNNSVEKMAQDGSHLATWKNTGYEPGYFVAPDQIALNASGHVFVSSRGATVGSIVQEFDANGQYIQTHADFPDNVVPTPQDADSLFALTNMTFQVDCHQITYQGVAPDGVAFTRTHPISQDLELPAGSACGGAFSFQVHADAQKNVYVLVRDNDRMIENFGFMDLYTIQKVSPSGELLAEFGGTGNFPGQFEYQTKNMAVTPDGRIYVVDRGNHRIQVFNSLQTVDNSKAIIVAGGGPYPGNNLWSSTQAAANFAFRSMMYQGFNKGTIHYLSATRNLDLDGNGLHDEVDADATLANLQQAIITWAADAENVYLYLTDHGGNGTFRMSALETLSATALDQWLDELQSKIPGKLVVIYDACESGSFLQALTPPTGKSRVVMTSTSPGESAAFISQGAVSFSNYFWTYLFNGLTLANAFTLTQEALLQTTSNQHPLLDANGNGVANEVEDLVALGPLSMGSGTTAIGNAPVIGSVSPTQQISETNQGTIWAADVTDSDGINRVWAVVRPPNYQADNQLLPVQSLPEIEMSLVGNRYEGTFLNFSTTGTYQVAIYAQDAMGNNAVPKLTTVVVNSPLTRKAVIVAGGELSDPDWISVENKSKLVYSALRTQGYAEEDIRYLSTSASAGVDGLANRANLMDALTIWAKDHTQDVVIYLVGIGRSKSLRLNATETLTSSTLDLWLDELQNVIPGKVTVIVEADFSGSFLPGLKPPTGKERIVITSAKSTGQSLSMAQGNISFSHFFWKQVVNGATVRDAFIYARKALAFSGNFTPQLDDDGNGINNSMDGRLSRYYNIGMGVLLAGDDPMVGSVSAPQVVDGGTTAVIRAEQVTTTGALQSVWAVISAPGPLSQPVNVLMNDVGNGVYEVSYNNFVVQGEYQVNVFAMDLAGNISLPVGTTVTQTSGLDIYEEDDTFATAQAISLNDDLPQAHHLHKAGDSDWVKFYAMAGEVYEIKVSQVGAAADLAIDLYGTDGETLLTVEDSFLEGEDELLTWTAESDGIYYARVYASDPGVFGANTNYQLQVYQPFADVTGIIQGIIASDLNFANLAGALIKATSLDGQQILNAALSSVNGMFRLAVTPGTLNIQSLVSNFESKTVSQVSVAAGEVVQLDLMLTPVNHAPTLTGTPATAVNENSAYSFTPVAVDVDAGARLSFSVVNPPAWALFDQTTGRLSGTPTQADVGVTRAIVITVTDGLIPVSLPPFDVTVVNVNDLPQGAVIITGTLTQGQILTADTTTLSDADGLGTLHYQWKAGTTNIGTDSRTLVLTEAEVGKTLSVTVSYTDLRNATESVTSGVTGTVANLNDAPGGGVTITGTPTQGQTLTADTTTLSDADGLGILHYQWKAGAVNIGTDSRTLVLTEAEVGKTISVTVSYTDLRNATESVTSGVTGTVANLNDAPGGGVTITGTPTQGQTLTADTVTLSDADGVGAKFFYQWKAGGVLVGTDSRTLLLTEAEVGKSITVTVSYMDGHNTHESVTSVATDAVVNVNDLPAGGVTITGSATKGNILSANTLDLLDLDGLRAFSYQWKADGNAIIGATEETFLLTGDEVGKVITVTIRYTDGHGTDESVTSVATSPVVNVNDPPTGSVTITGLAKQGETLSVTNTLGDADGMGTVSYQWKAEGVSILGATGNTLLLTEAHVGKQITVAAGYTDGHGSKESMTSVATSAVVNVNDPPTGSVAITGMALPGQTLMAANTLMDVDGMGTVGYQWLADGVAINGATGDMLLLTDQHAGKTITVTATYTDGHGTLESISSSSVTLEKANTKPTIVSIADLSVPFGQTPVMVPLTISDPETATNQLIFTVKSFNTDLLPDANIQVEKTPQTRLILTPVPGKIGSALVLLSVGDGTETVSASFNLTVEAEVPVVTSKTISGVIKNAAGVGVANVLVRLQPEFDPATGMVGTWAETLTDANGQYTFDVLPGQYRVEFLTSYQKDGTMVTLAGNLVGGFADGAGGIIHDREEASLLQVTDATQLNAVLATGMTLSGTVQKSGGVPIAGAEVNVHSQDWTVFYHARTNAEGVFSVVVKPGLNYQVEVWPAYCETMAQGCVGQESFQGGNWIAPQDASWVSGWSATDVTTQPVVVASGVIAGTDVAGTVMALSDDHWVTSIQMDQSLAIRVLVDSGTPILGRVVDANGAGVADAWVDTPFGGGATNANGTFTINLPSATGATIGLMPFKVRIFPGGHVDPTTQAWVQGTGFVGGVVSGNVTSGFKLAVDEAQAVEFTPTATAWPAMDLLGDGSLSGLLVRANSGITITGKVQNSSQAGLANLWVNAWSQESNQGAGAATNSQGDYTIQIPTPDEGVTVWYELNLWSDRYLVPEPRLVKVQSGGVVGVYQIDKSQFTAGSAGTGGPVAGAVIDNGTHFTLGTGNTISGRVVNANNQGMPWTWVDVHTRDGSQWYGANTDENGYYSLTVAPANNYIGVVWGGHGQYRTTFYKNAAREENATLIDASGGHVTNVNFMLGSGATISGTITGLPSGKKVWLSVWSEQENGLGGVEVTGRSDATPVSFSISGLAAAQDYRLEWRSSVETIQGGYYGGVPGGAASGAKGWEQSTLLNTTNGNVTGVAIDLTPATTHTLHVKIEGLDGVSLVDVSARSDKLNKGRWKQAAVVSGSATIDLGGLDALGDDYRLFVGGPGATFKVGNFQGEVSGSAYPTTSGTLVGLDRATLINMATDQYVYVKVNGGHQLTVTVVGLTSGQKAWVDAFSETTGAWGGGEVKYVNGLTDKVVIKGLATADDYRISIWGDKIQGGSYAGQDQNGHPKAPGSWETAELVDLSADAAISMSVSSGKSIAGTVSGLKSKESAWVEAWSNSTFSWGGQTVQAAGSGADGYTLAGVGQAADFKVSFKSPGYVPQSQSGVDTTTQNATGINFTATTGGSITGSITGLNAFEWVRLDAWSPAGDHFIVGGVSADAQGAATYTLSGVPAASDYVVGLWRGDKGLFYATTGVTPVWDNHSKVTVTGSEATRSIHFDLTSATNLFFTLSGTLSGLSADQVVEIRAWSDTAGASTTLTGNGQFKLEGLPAGNYTVEVTSNGYAPQHTSSVTVSNGVVSKVTWSTGWNNQGTVAVTANTTGLDVVLSKGYSMKGSVTNNGAAVSGVWVNAWSEADHVGGGAVTNSKGEFIIKGLPNLTYKVDVWTPDGTDSRDVTLNGVNQTGVALTISKAGGSIAGNVTTSTGGVAGEAMVIAFDSQGAEKKRAVSNPSTGAYVLDGLTVGASYTVKAFSAAKAKAGNWTTETGYATGTATAASGGATLNLGLK